MAESKEEQATELRRTPVQTRSRQRFEGILDAASVLFADNDFDTVTMEGIARAAETSVGSLYRFFPNKRAVFRAIAERNLERFRDLHAELTSFLDRPWYEVIDSVIDGLEVYKKSDPGYRAVSANLSHYGVYEEGDEALKAEFIKRTEAIICHYAPDVSSSQRNLLARMVTYTIAGVSFFANRENESCGGQVLDETKRMLRAYLAPFING